jgi:hypothetical protein
MNARASVGETLGVLNNLSQVAYTLEEKILKQKVDRNVHQYNELSAEK